MRGTNGRYFPERLTDANGRIGPLIVQPWTSIEGRLDIWSPFATSIVSGGLTADYSVSAVGERYGADSVHLIIQDIVVPEVVVTAPSNGSVVNLRNLPIDGFLFETGSGVETFRGWVDTEEPIEITPATVWSAQFRSLLPGEHTMWLEVKDRSGNMDMVQLEFTIDAQAPTLSITSPVQGLITRDPQVYIQGMYLDDLSELTDIVVRINNALVTEGSPGTLNYPFTLSEGVNAIVVDATDAAGNKAVVTLTITLDTYPPTLYITSPLDDLLTSEDVLLVEGISDADTSLMVQVIQGGVVKRTEELTTLGDGTFIVSVPLYEGEQVINVTATDSPAKNMRTVLRTVTRDTTPPKLFIDSPAADTTYIKTTTLTLSGHVEDAKADMVVVRVNGRLIVHSGTFSVPVSLLEGPNIITVTAEDEAGNIASETRNVIRDTVPPMLDVDTPEYLLTSNPDLVIKGTTNRDAVSVTVLGEQVSVDLDGRFTTTVDLSVVTTPITIVATDMAGNMAIYEIDFLYDGTKPTMSLDTMPSQTHKTVAFVNGTVSDDKSTITSVMIMGLPFPVIDGKFNAIVDLKTTGNGWNNFTVEAQDAAGNKATLRVNVQYVPPPPTDTNTDTGPSNEALSWVGVVLLAAGLTLLMTAWVLSKREVRK
jgi:nitrogen fixation protein FixH